MRDTDLFQLALGLLPPWLVAACRFNATAKQIDIDVDFAKGGRFPCPACPFRRSRSGVPTDRDQMSRALWAGP